MIKGSWKVINIYLEEDQGGKEVKVRRYKCTGKGCGEVHKSWSACDAHINKKHLNQVYSLCHDKNCPFTNYNRDTFIAHVKKCKNLDKQKHKVKLRVNTFGGGPYSKLSFFTLMHLI